MARVFIGGVPFMALDHHDGRFVRTGGLFAFAHTPSDDFLVLHFEMAAAINRVADHSHPRWGWCLGQGMDTLLVHMAGRPACLPADASPNLETVLWHAEAQMVMSDVLSETDPSVPAEDGDDVPARRAPPTSRLALIDRSEKPAAHQGFRGGPPQANRSGRRIARAHHQTCKTGTAGISATM